MKKVLLIIAIIIIVIVLGAVLTLGYFGFIPSISKLLGTDQPRDLGIEYTDEDLKSVSKKTKAEVKTLKASQEPEKSLKTSGEKKAEFEMNSAEFTALANYYAQNWEYYPAESMQIRINEDGTGESSGIARVDKIIGYIKATGNNYSEEDIQKALDYLQLSRKDSIPFYFKISGKVENNKLMGLKAEKLEIGRFPVPLSMVEGVIPQATTFGNDQIKDFKGLEIKNAGIKDGKIKFSGQVPAKVEIAPR